MFANFFSSVSKKRMQKLAIANFHIPAFFREKCSSCEKLSSAAVKQITNKMPRGAAKDEGRVGGIAQAEAKRNQQSAPVTNQKKKPKRKGFLCNFFAASAIATDVQRKKWYC